MERHLYKMKKDIPYQVFGFGPLIYKAKLSNKEKTDLKNLCKKDKKKDHRSRLAGNIRNEYSIDHIKYEKIINNYLEVFEKDAYPFFYKRKALSKLKCVSAWVNFMKKGEYNPPHIHQNADFSSFLFLNLPKNLKKEMDCFIGTSSKPGQTIFTVYPTMEHHITTVYITPEIGDLYIFPWNVNHSVNSFSSKGERTSIAANFKFEK
jgi:hypothetical protein|tara:strand:- start:1446 stop:2063 length:618 start_codon:yes stop_codon:yes gene_type:complete